MGLASKLRESQPPQNPQAQAASQGGPPQAGYPGQPSYQAYPGGAPAPGAPGQPGQPPPQQYGQPPQQYPGGPPPQQYPGGPPPQQYPGGPPPQQYPGGPLPQQYPGGPPSQQHAQASPHEIEAYKQVLTTCIQEKGLQSFYSPPQDQILNSIAQKAPSLVQKVVERWNVPKELATDVLKLALYDIVLYIDDSGSMQFEEGGERLQDLRIIIDRVAFAATLFDPDGISMRFMNKDYPGLQDNIASEAQITRLMRDVQFAGLTPLGTSLQTKIIEPLVLGKARSGTLRRPVLVITVTDGQPAGEAQNAVFEFINNAYDELRRTQYGAGAVAFEFAQVGNDQLATKFLKKLDEDPVVGPMIDCTSNFETEQNEMENLREPVKLTPDGWIIKLLLGAIDSSYDTKDEDQRRPAGPPGGPGGYNAPPQGNYPPQQQPYGGPPQQYGQQQQQQYGQSQSGYGGAPPPGQYPGQAQYGQPQQRPPQGYPGQQPPYGGPPRY